jgi:hypothetical protein
LLEFEPQPSPAGGRDAMQLPALTLYNAYEAQADKRLAEFKERPQVEREVEYFTSRLAEIETVEDFVDDRRLMQFALSAFSMDGEEQYPARVQAIITEDHTDDDSLVNRMIDPRFKEIAEFLDFANSGLDKLKEAANTSTIIDKFHTNEYEKDMGEQNPALREMAYFKRNIDGIEDAYGILGDSVLLGVVQQVFNLPVEMAFQSVEKQKELIDARMDIEDLKDPEFLDRFAQRFLIAADQEANAAGTALGWQASLLAGSTSGNNSSAGLFNLLV